MCLPCERGHTVLFVHPILPQFLFYSPFDPLVTLESTPNSLKSRETHPSSSFLPFSLSLSLSLSCPGRHRVSLWYTYAYSIHSHIQSVPLFAFTSNASFSLSLSLSLSSCIKEGRKENKEGKKAGRNSNLSLLQYDLFHCVSSFLMCSMFTQRTIEEAKGEREPLIQSSKGLL